jgi:hypothetical protein
MDDENWMHSVERISLSGSLDGYHDGYGDDADDRNPYLEDDTYHPLQQILTSIANEERSVRIEKLKVALSELTDKQRIPLSKVLSWHTNETDCSRRRCFRGSHP